MWFEGDIDVLRSLWEKAHLLARRDPQERWIRPALLILGGTMRGILGAAITYELEQRGLTSCFDNVVGVSTGAPVAAYFCAEQADLAVKLYLEEGLSKNFINVRRMLVGSAPVDCDYAASIFRGATDKQLDQDAARRARSGLWAAVSYSLTGAPYLVDLKAEPDMVHGIRASIAIPGCSDEVWIGGCPVLDGSVACPLPVSLLVERFRPTHVLILANRSEVIRDSLLSAFFERYVMRKMSDAFAQAMRTQESRFRSELAWLRGQDEVKWAVIWSDNSLHALTRDHAALHGAAARAQHHFADLLLRAQV